MSLHNWRFLPDAPRISHAEPTTEHNTGVKGHGSEGGKRRDMKFENNYIVSEITYNRVVQNGTTFTIYDENGDSYTATWGTRFQNTKWAHHKNIDEVVALLTALKKRRLIKYETIQISN